MPKGKPTKTNPIQLRQILSFSLQGLTNSEIAGMLELHVQTISRAKSGRKYQAFCQYISKQVSEIEVSEIERIII